MSRLLLTIVLLCLLLTSAPLHALSPSLMLAEQWRDGPDVSQFMVSEKLDGVRARWDGSRLWSRAGHPIPAPAWFTRGWPRQPLDGELWMGRNRFEATSAIIRSSPANDADWNPLRFMAFDLPAHTGGFGQRFNALEALVRQARNPHLEVIAQQRIADNAQLQQHLRAIVDAGGEGLMLHHQDNRYSAGRSEGLFKLKLFDDAEARIIGYVPGKGKYVGMVGALMVERADGRRFRLGSGLKDAQRADPPPIGSQVTYRYNGLTVHGLPRFPRFLRVRDEAPSR
ncbi:DNA ligase [Stenotrophomonas sp. SY1]|uniref:DNA ligase n=1 Tax=Stenotrophomonas sp. SY1 TaxID=477235 RepID=UPI001E5E7E01|nr:DNA ligase [Stenotrophomonas sp. SY1]MCD9086764.1 DNA ligase [Stenotrophomonas sp. SY1]